MTFLARSALLLLISASTVDFSTAQCWPTTLPTETFIKEDPASSAAIIFFDYEFKCQTYVYGWTALLGTNTPQPATVGIWYLENRNCNLRTSDCVMILRRSQTLRFPPNKKDQWVTVRTNVTDVITAQAGDFISIRYDSFATQHTAIRYAVDLEKEYNTLLFISSKALHEISAGGKLSPRSRNVNQGKFWTTAALKPDTVDPVVCPTNNIDSSVVLKYTSADRTNRQLNVDGSMLMISCPADWWMIPNDRCSRTPFLCTNGKWVSDYPECDVSALRCTQKRTCSLADINMPVITDFEPTTANPITDVAENTVVNIDCAAGHDFQEASCGRAYICILAVWTYLGQDEGKDCSITAQVCKSRWDLFCPVMFLDKSVEFQLTDIDPLTPNYEVGAVLATSCPSGLRFADPSCKAEYECTVDTVWVNKNNPECVFTDLECAERGPLVCPMADFASPMVATLLSAGRVKEGSAVTVSCPIGFGFNYEDCPHSFQCFNGAWANSLDAPECSATTLNCVEKFKLACPLTMLDSSVNFNLLDVDSSTADMEVGTTLVVYCDTGAVFAQPDCEPAYNCTETGWDILQEVAAGRCDVDKRSCVAEIVPPPVETCTMPELGEGGNINITDINVWRFSCQPGYMLSAPESCNNTDYACVGTQWEHTVSSGCVVDPLVCRPEDGMCEPMDLGYGGVVELLADSVRVGCGEYYQLPAQYQQCNNTQYQCVGRRWVSLASTQCDNAPLKCEWDGTGPTDLCQQVDLGSFGETKYIDLVGARKTRFGSYMKFTCPNPEYPFPVTCNEGLYRCNGLWIDTDGVPCDVNNLSCATVKPPADVCRRVTLGIGGDEKYEHLDAAGLTKKFSFVNVKCKPGYRLNGCNVGWHLCDGRWRTFTGDYCNILTIRCVPLPVTPALPTTTPLPVDIRCLSINVGSGGRVTFAGSRYPGIDAWATVECNPGYVLNDRSSACDVTYFKCSAGVYSPWRGGIGTCDTSNLRCISWRDLQALNEERT